MKIVLVTGASQGIGLATAVRLARSNCRVYGLVRATSNLDAFTALAKEYPNLSYVIGDVTDSASVERVFEQIIREQGTIDVVINNACTIIVGTFERCTIEEQKRSMDVNYFGPVRVCQTALPYMRAQKSGQIINISGVVGYEPFPHIDAYVAPKFALEALTESLATQGAPWNICVSLVEPASVKTEAQRKAPFGSREPMDGAHRTFCEKAKATMVDMYRFSMPPEEIAAVIEEIMHSEKPHLRYPIGPFAKERAKARFCDPTGDSYVTFKNKLVGNGLSAN